MPRPADLNAKIDLLRAAEAVFAERGVEHAKIEEITARAGRSKGSFYLHFSSKEDAFRELVASLLARLKSFLDEADRFANATSPFGDPEAFLDGFLALDLAIFEFVWQNRAVFRLIVEGGKSATFFHLVDEFHEQARRASIASMQRGVERGLYRPDLDVEIASLVVSAAYDRIARDLVRLDKKPDLRPLLVGLQALTLRMVLSDDAWRHVDRAVRNRTGEGNRKGPPAIKAGASPGARSEENRDTASEPRREARRSGARSGRPALPAARKRG